MTFVLLADEPMFDGLHTDPRFKQLVARIHSVAPELGDAAQGAGSAR